MEPVEPSNSMQSAEPSSDNLFTMTNPELYNRFYRTPSPPDPPPSHKFIDDIFEAYKGDITKIVTDNPHWNVVREHIDVKWRTEWVSYTASHTDYNIKDIEFLLNKFREHASPFIAAYHVDQVISHPQNATLNLSEVWPIMKRYFEALQAWPCLLRAIEDQIRAAQFKRQHEDQLGKALREAPQPRLRVRKRQSKKSNLQKVSYSKLIQTVSSLKEEDNRPKYLKEFFDPQNPRLAETFIDYYMYKQDYGKGLFMLHYPFWRENLVALGTEGKFLIYVYQEKTRLWEIEPRGIVKGLIREFWHMQAEYLTVELNNGIKDAQDLRLCTLDKDALEDFFSTLDTSCGYGRQIEGSNKIMEAITPHLYQNSKINSQGEKDIFLLKLNRNADALPLGGGHTINLQTGDIRPRQREDYWSYDTGFDYDRNVDITEMNNYVLDVMGCDVEKMRFLQRVAGYCLTAHTRERKIFIFWGSGNNSKSTFLDLLRRAMGCIDVTDSKKGLYLEANKGLILEIKDNDPDKPSPAVMMTMGRRLVVCSELVTKDKVETGFCKKFASDGEMLSGRWLNCDPIQFENTAKLILQTNNKPAIPSDEEGRAFWNRILFLPFLEIYSERPVENEKLIDRALILRLRNNLSAVLKWCIIGAQDWYRQGLNPPQSVLDATAEYKAENDHVSQFITEDLDVSNPNTRTRPEELHAAYCNWRNHLNNRGAPHYTTQQFGQELGRRGHKSKSSNGLRSYHGICIKSKALLHSGTVDPICI